MLDAEVVASLAHMHILGLWFGMLGSVAAAYFELRVQLEPPVSLRRPEDAVRVS